MARRYTRREFLTDASFALGSSILLKVFAPPTQAQPATAIAPVHLKPSEAATTSEG